MIEFLCSPVDFLHVWRCHSGGVTAVVSQQRCHPQCCSFGGSWCSASCFLLCRGQTLLHKPLTSFFSLSDAALSLITAGVRAWGGLFRAFPPGAALLCPCPRRWCCWLLDGTHTALLTVTHSAAATAASRWIFSSTHCFYSVSGETKILLWSPSFISQPPPQEAKPHAQPSCFCFAACRCSLPRAALS